MSTAGVNEYPACPHWNRPVVVSGVRSATVLLEEEMLLLIWVDHQGHKIGAVESTALFVLGLVASHAVFAVW